MSASLNRASIIGNLGADPEVRSTSGGTRVATLSVATNRRWTDDAGEEQERTEWHRVVAWDRLAEIAQEYLGKGARIYVEGRIEYRTWTGDDGQERYTTEIRARRLLMLGSTSRGGSRQSRSVPSSEERSPRKPTREEKHVAGALGGRSGRQEQSVHDEPPVGGDDDLPF